MGDPTVDLVAALGGRDELDRIVEDLYIRVQNDPLLAPIFTGVDYDRLVGMQQEFLATALGGTAGRSGSALRAIHGGRGITPQHFSRFVEHFLGALESRYVDDEVTAAVGRRLGLYLEDVTGSTPEAG